MKRANMSNPNSGNNNNNNKASLFSSYQQGSSSYQPPVHYAADQSKTLEDTTSTYYQADETAQKILQQMQAQRGQIRGAHDDVWDMRQATEKAKREMYELRNKYRERKNRLYMIIAVLSVTDFMLFLRILQCRGNFYC